MIFFNSEAITKEYYNKLGSMILMLAILELLLGLALLITPGFGITVVFVMLGITIVIAGVIEIAYTLRYEATTGKKVLGFILGALYICAGIFTMTEIEIATLYTTLLLSFALIFESVVLFSNLNNVPSKGLTIFNAIITMMLGFMLLVSFPVSALVLPCYFGLSFLFNAIVLFTNYFYAKELVTNASDDDITADTIKIDDAMTDSSKTDDVVTN